MPGTPPWRIQADYMESCNCEFGCPCNFGGFPSDGHCEALVGYHVRSGHYGEVKLHDLDFVMAAAWPKAVHEGNGTVRIFITDRALPEQRRALADIAYGRAGGSGCFKIFAATFRYVLDPQFVPIEMRVDGARSRFSVPGVLDVALSPHLDPVSGEEHDVELHLPKGFIWQTARAVKTAVMRILSPNLNFDHAGRSAFHTVVDHQGP